MENKKTQINIKNIYWMLAYAFRSIDIDGVKKFNGENFENVYDLFCVMLTQGISQQIKRGLNKDYVQITEEISGIRGKINISETVNRNALINKKVVCEFDEYSNNSYLNRIIKTTALYLIKSNKIEDSDRKNNLKKVLLFFKDIDEIEIKDINWSLIKYNRNNASYKFLINVCKFILEGLLINEETGTLEFLEFIDDQKLYRLYEKFIFEYFRITYNDELEVSSPQIKWDLEENKFIEFLPIMQSDVILKPKYSDKELIIDAKFYTKILQKKYDKETYRNNNIYQIFTYLKNEDSENTRNVAGMLLYAKTDDEDIGWKEMTISKSKIIITDLDLSKDFSVIEEKMEIIKNWVNSF